jgi:hypothetical protein
MAPTAVEPWVKSFGVIDGGLERMRLAWPSLRHVFSAACNTIDLPPPMGVSKKPRLFQGTHRYPPDLLNQHPVNLRTVNRGSNYQPPATYARSPWANLVSTTRSPNRPQLLIETWPASAQMWNKGPVSKAHTTIWNDLSATPPAVKLFAPPT